MSAVIEEWLGNPLARSQVARELSATLRDEIVKVGATGRTADRILSDLAPLDSGRKVSPAPHDRRPASRLQSRRRLCHCSANRGAPTSS